jgi:hypothetical protein
MCDESKSYAVELSLKLSFCLLLVSANCHSRRSNLSRKGQRSANGIYSTFKETGVYRINREISDKPGVYRTNREYIGQTGSISDKPTAYRPRTSTERESSIAVLAKIALSPKRSLRKTSSDTELPQTRLGYME